MCVTSKKNKSKKMLKKKEKQSLRWGSIPEVLLVRLNGGTGGRVTGLVVWRVAALADFWWAGVFALADFGGEKLTALAMVPPV